MFCSRSRNALLNGDTQHYDWDSGYTCHQLRSGSIIVQLGQPYMLSSIRLLLWDCDERAYNYYVETSINLYLWELVADRTRIGCRSWQTLTFDPRPVVFIRIVGTHNTANEVFHCVHLECPAKDGSETPKTIVEVDSNASENGAEEAGWDAASTARLTDVSVAVEVADREETSDDESFKVQAGVRPPAATGQRACASCNSTLPTEVCR